MMKAKGKEYFIAIGFIFGMLLGQAFGYPPGKQKNHLRVSHYWNMLLKKDNTHKTWLALGDSYTIAESLPFTEGYPLQTAQLLRKDSLDFEDPKVIATTGWTTADLKMTLDQQISMSDHYDLVSLLIGVNDQYQGQKLGDYKTRFEQLLIKAIRYAGNRPSHVIVLSIPDYGHSPFGQASGRAEQISREIDSFNQANREISLAHQVLYLDITPESRLAAYDSSLIAPDGLHYSAKEYAIWATRLCGLIKSIFVHS